MFQSPTCCGNWSKDFRNGTGGEVFKYALTLTVNTRNAATTSNRVFNFMQTSSLWLERRTYAGGPPRPEELRKQKRTRASRRRHGRIPALLSPRNKWPISRYRRRETHSQR